MNIPAPRSCVRWTLIGFLTLSGARVAAQVDCLGVNGGTALPGTPCDDGNANSTADVWNNYCICVGYCTDWMEGGSTVPGGACDDGNMLTINDVMSAECYCHGICAPLFGWPGDPCDDGDPLTSDDIVDQWGCSCYGWTNLISGQVFLDLDANGIFNGTDMPIQNRVVQAGPYQFYTNTDATGAFSFRLTPAIYTVMAAAGSFDAPSAVLPPIDLSTPGTSSVGNALPMGPTASQTDLSVHIASGPARPGFGTYMTVVCKNEGTLSTNGTLTLTFDPLQTVHNQSPAGTIAGNTITWALPVLQLGEVFSADVRFFTPVATPLGTILNYTAAVATLPADGVPANDVYNAALTVVGSFDPNDIAVAPELLTMDDLRNGVPVTYTIRFQNTGTAAAEHVRITDLLPMQVDQASFDFVASSHPCHAQLSDGMLRFDFENIALPDSGSDEPNSHGWVMFRMRPRNFLLPGAVVPNAANIYFDANPAVPTNAANFAIDQTTAVPVHIAPAMQLRPDPAVEEVTLICSDRSATTMEVIVFDVNGRVVLADAGAVVDGAYTVHVQQLHDGIYTMRGRAAAHTFVQRFVKTH